MNEILVLGGGVIGLSLAYELARRGRAVTVVDIQALGQGASAAAAGILPPPSTSWADDPVEQLRTAAHRLHFEWHERLLHETGIDSQLRRCGGLYVARHAAEAAMLRVRAAELSSEGVRGELLTVAELIAREPALAAVSSQIQLGLLLPDESRIRGPLLLAALQAACAQLGVKLLPWHGWLAWEFSAGQVVGVHLTHTPVDCAATTLPAPSALSSSALSSSALSSSAVTPSAATHSEVSSSEVIPSEVTDAPRVLTSQQYVICTGTHTQSLMAPLGLHVPIEPRRGQMLRWNAPDVPLRHILNEGLRYLVPREDGHILAGATVEDVGFDRRTTPAGLQQLVEFSQSWLPQLRGREPKQSWAGLRPWTPDGAPYMGAVPGWSNIWISAGHFRSGLHLAPAAAVAVADAIEGRASELDLRPYRIER